MSAFAIMSDAEVQNNLAQQGNEMAPISTRNANYAEINSSVFGVSASIHYGYSLYRPENSDPLAIEFVRFANNRARRQFDEFFRQDNLRQFTGKKIYCRCIGRLRERDGVTYYLVQEAHVFAR